MPSFLLRSTEISDVSPDVSRFSSLDDKERQRQCLESEEPITICGLRCSPQSLCCLSPQWGEERLLPGSCHEQLTQTMWADAFQNPHCHRLWSAGRGPQPPCTAPAKSPGMGQHTDHRRLSPTVLEAHLVPGEGPFPGAPAATLSSHHVLTWEEV